MAVRAQRRRRQNRSVSGERLPPRYTVLGLDLLVSLTDLKVIRQPSQPFACDRAGHVDMQDATVMSKTVKHVTRWTAQRICGCTRKYIYKPTTFHTKAEASRC